MAELGDRVPDDWFVGFHRGMAARFWRMAGAAMLDADWAVVGQLLSGYRSVLDAPCGDGRMSGRLAEAGHQVLGVDISSEEIAHARESHPGVEFAVADLRALPDGPFDAVLSWGNSFGYLTPEDSLSSLGGMRRALRPGGRLVLDSGGVAESLLPGGVEEDSEHDFGGISVSVRHGYDPHRSRQESEYVFTDRETGETETTGAAHHVHTTGELVRMLRAAGFASVALLGPDGQAPYAVGDAKVIAVADV